MRIDFSKLDNLKSKLDGFRPFSQAMLNNLHESLVLQWTYHSNAIEGNTLTLKETRVALEGITVGGKSLREHFEVINHRDAILFVEKLVQDNQALSEWQIKQIHQLILRNIDDENAGCYRRMNVTIAGANHVPPDSVQLADLMAAFINWYQKSQSLLHPIELAARVHADFVKIHPFTDGNGRTSRLLMNLELMKCGFPPVVLTVERRLEYYQALDLAHTQNNYQPFLELCTELAVLAFSPYWHALGVSV